MRRGRGDRRFRAPRLTYANVVATIALFLALGGGAWAALRLPANSVGTRELKQRSITRKTLAFALGARTHIDRRVHEFPNPTPGCSEIPPGQVPPPCAPPAPRKLTSATVRTTRPGLLVVQATMTVADYVTDDGATVQLTATVDGKRMPDVTNLQIAGPDVRSLSYQGAVVLPAGPHTVSFSAATSNGKKAGEVDIGPVTVTALSLPQLAGK